MPVRRIRCIWQIGRLGEANGATLDLKEEQENSNARHVRTPIGDFSAPLGRTLRTGRERHRRGHAALKDLPTNLFIYLIEDYGELSERVVKIRERMLKRGDELYTSTLTLGEILVRPLDENREELAADYELALTSAAVVIPFDRPASRSFATIRRDRSVKPPDAI